MRQISTIFLFQLLTISVFGNGLGSQKSTFLFNHLVEVNEQWHYQNDIKPAIFKQKIQFENDIERIQTHLKLVEQTLRNRTTTHLSENQKTNRLRHLDVLHQYSETAVFPTNTFHSERQPYFVDIFGVHCAVGYLLHKDGQDNLVQQIKTNNNYAYIKALTTYKSLGKWAKNNGFTVDELAWIQPGYAPAVQNYKAVGNNGGVNGSINVMKTNADSSKLFIAGDFTMVDGVNAKSIVSWDGTNWETYGNIDGAIYDMDWHNGLLVVVGDFSLNGQICNIAYWSVNDWFPLQTGDMQGAIYTIAVVSNTVHVGGDFQKVNGVSMPYLAYQRPNSGVWANNGFNINTGLTIPNAFGVDAPVKCMKVIGGQLLVGGEFTQTAPSVSDSSLQINTNYLAFWDGNKWTNGLYGNHGAVNTFTAFNNKIYVAGNANSVTPLATLELGVWSHFGGFFPMMNGEMSEFVPLGNRLFLVGDFNYSPQVVGNYGRGLIDVTGQPYPITVSDSAITAAATFQGEVYIGGRFSNIDGQNVNQLASSLLDKTSSNHSVQADLGKVFYNNDRIVLEQKDATNLETFELYNVSGRVILTKKIQNNNRQEIPTHHLPKGIYFYQWYNGEVRQTGKLGVF
ncbi:MAG: T9SS type A sorting domain-containing protein [Saprospiraceae bacterium]